MRNERLSSFTGEVLMVSVYPELLVTDAMKEKWAKEVIAEYESDGNQGDNWTCENCGEEHGAQFKDCWNCQSIKAF